MNEIVYKRDSKNNSLHRLLSNCYRHHFKPHPLTPVFMTTKVHEEEAEEEEVDGEEEEGGGAWGIVEAWGV